MLGHPRHRKCEMEVASLSSPMVQIVFMFEWIVIHVLQGALVTRAGWSVTRVKDQGVIKVHFKMWKRALLSLLLVPFFFFFFKYPLEFKEWGAVSRGYQWKAVRNVHKGSSSEKNSQTSLWSHRWAAHKEEGVLIFAAGQPNLRYEKDCLSLPRLCHEIWIPAANATSSFKNKYGCTHNVYKIKWIFKHAEMGWMKKIIRHYCQKVYILQKNYICIYIKNYILQNYYYYFFNILAYGCQT